MVPLDSSEEPFYLEVAGEKVRGLNPVWTPDSRGLTFSQVRGGIGSLWYLPVDEDRRPTAPAAQLTTGGGRAGGGGGGGGTTTSLIFRQTEDT